MPVRKSRSGTVTTKASSLRILPDLSELVIESKWRTINIRLESYHNIKPFFPIADIQASIKYGENIVGITTVIPITDDDITIDQNFSFVIDINNPKDLHALLSTPATLMVDQIKGRMDENLYPHLQVNSQLHLITPVKSFDSIVSIYEALNTKDVEISKQPKEKKIKKKKESKTLMSKSSKSGKHSGKGSGKLSSVKSNKSTSAMNDGGEPLPVYEPTIFGMCCLDFMPLFTGQKSFQQTLLIKPLVEYRDNKMLSFKAHPEISVTVTTDDDFDLMSATFLNFTLETIYNIPEVMGPDMEYWVCAMLPMLHGRKVPLLFTNPAQVSTTQGGILKLWPGTSRVYRDANATEYATPPDNKDIICKFDPDYESYIDDHSPRLQFVMTNKHMMYKDAISDLINHIRVYRKIVLEIYVATKEKHKKHSVEISGKLLDFGAKRGGKSSQFLHLMAILDVAVLMYPGVKSIRVAAPVTTFSAEEAAKYGGLDDSFFTPAPKKENKERDGKDSRERTAKSENKSSKGSKSPKSKEKKSGNLSERLPPKPIPPPEPVPSMQVYNEDGQPCFVVVDIELSNALVPTRKVEDLQEELSMLVKEKNNLNMFTHSSILSSCMTLDYFTEVLNGMILDLNKKFMAYITENPHLPIGAEAFNKTSFRFIDFLKNEGIYESYISAIQKATALLVSRKFKNVAEENRRQYQKFIGDIFVFLISKMNTTVNKLMCHGMEPHISVEKADKNFFYAKEAMDTNRRHMADRYLLERICNEQTGEHWFDYGILFLEKGEEDVAYECMKEALLKEPQHKYSLLVLGTLLSNKGLKEDAETCFLNLMLIDSTWTVGWAVLYLFYQKTENCEGMDRTIGMANKNENVTPPPDYFSEYDELVWTSKICPETIFFRTAVLLLKLRLYEWAEMSLAQEIIKYPGFVHYMLAAICYYKKMYEHAMEHLEETLKYYGPDYAVSSLMGHCLLALGEKLEAKKQYDYALESFNRPIHLHLVNINLAKILGRLGNDQEARKLVLLACKYNPTPYTWYLAGIYYYQENDFLSAEECFSEGNAMDNRFAEIWGYLALVNSKLHRKNEAELCLDEALKNNLSNEHILELIEEATLNCNSDSHPIQ